MISDVLFDAVSEIDRYLKDPVLKESYAGELRKDIIKLRDEMEKMQQRLDTPPGVTRDNRIIVNNPDKKTLKLKRQLRDKT